MTLLLNCDSLSKSHGSKQLFSDISLSIFKGEKIGLVGPNGSGKSTLLKILSGFEKPDSGTVSCRKSLKIGYIPQSSEYPETSVRDLVFQAYHSAHLQASLAEMEAEVAILLSKLGFEDHQVLASSLSGGWKKRLDLSRQLINQPDILLLDEPTNHLDLNGILWLESFLKREAMTFIVTSHDRYFLDAVATKMLELNPVYPQGLFTCDGNYAEFAKCRNEFISNQQQYERALSSKVRGEIEWLRKGPKARTTKSQARIISAGRLIDELSALKNRNKQPRAKIDFEGSDKETKKLLSAKNVTKSLGGRLIFSGIDLTLSPGMRLGIVGTNGSGKTTLLKILAGEIFPDKGTIKYAEGLRIVYFDQHRQALNPNDTLREALSPNSDMVLYRGQHIHVNSWGKRFLFEESRMDLAVKQLSGGERARIGIARLMLKPADLLLLDEPTNDLDIQTLENLEASLSEFPGAIVIITHDRALLDRLATAIIGFKDGKSTPLLADYRQWEEFVKQDAEKTSPAHTASPKPLAKPQKSAEPSSSSQKLSYREKKELEGMEKSIVALEEKLQALALELEKCTANNQELQRVCQAIDETQKKLDLLFTRWEELELRKI